MLEFHARTEAQIKEESDKIELCSSRNHKPYEQKIAVPYSPGGNPLMRCSNCDFLYNREPTLRERNRYTSLMSLEVTI